MKAIVDRVIQPRDNESTYPKDSKDWKSPYGPQEFWWNLGTVSFDYDWYTVTNEKGEDMQVDNITMHDLETGE